MLRLHRCKEHKEVPAWMISVIKKKKQHKPYIILFLKKCQNCSAKLKSIKRQLWTYSPLASSLWAFVAGQDTPRQRGFGKTLSSITTSQSAWRRAPCSLSLSCKGLTLPCSQMSNLTCSRDSVRRQTADKESFTTVCLTSAPECNKENTHERGKYC